MNIRSLDVEAESAGAAADAIGAMYANDLDVLVVRRALAPVGLAVAGQRLDRNEVAVDWARPNQKMPVEDIQLLGTDTPATPTFQNPRGASFEAYLESAEKNQDARHGIFGGDFDPTNEIRLALEQFSGGRPCEVPVAADGRRYTPYTVRRLTDGKQIGIHHDYHYPLDLYKELSAAVDTTTLISWVFTLQRPERGGDLVVYPITPQTPDVPKLPNGFAYDQAKIDEQFSSERFTTEAGDLFLLASGRCLHRVDRIVGPLARVTMGGFLALDKTRGRVLFWS